MANLRPLLEGLIGAIAMNAQSGLPGRKRPEDVLSIQDALYKAVERDYLLSGEQVKQILNRSTLRTLCGERTKNGAERIIMIIQL